MDQRINDRGVMIDKELVQQAIICDMALSEAMTKRAYELTGLKIPILSHNSRHGLMSEGYPWTTSAKRMYLR
ncbi:MAG: hypothetical protein II916_05295 [Oscillospiraceae bacterium]|nr:hypothetical protein [Oscillospiraceae bacterium]